MEARPKEVTSEERYMVAITTHYAYIHLFSHAKSTTSFVI